jgi:hypothetical protein
MSKLQIIYQQGHVTGRNYAMISKVQYVGYGVCEEVKYYVKVDIIPVKLILTGRFNQLSAVSIFTQLSRL